MQCTVFPDLFVQLVQRKSSKAAKIGVMEVGKDLEADIGYVQELEGSFDQPELSPAATS